jgi:hypothetical protein
VAALHDTPSKAPPPAGVGTGRTDQADPSHRSASGRSPELLLVLTEKLPTAMQALGAGHDTARGKTVPGTAPGGLGTGSGDQADPFHCSAPPAPTAVQSLTAGHDTP